jgi:hypothetical protein
MAFIAGSSVVGLGSQWVNVHVMLFVAMVEIAHLVNTLLTHWTFLQCMFLNNTQSIL